MFSCSAIVKEALPKISAQFESLKPFFIKIDRMEDLIVRVNSDFDAIGTLLISFSDRNKIICREAVGGGRGHDSGGNPEECPEDAAQPVQQAAGRGTQRQSGHHQPQAYLLSTRYIQNRELLR